MKPTAIYARFSSDLQRDKSIADQLALCREYLARHNLELVAEYSDAAKTGASIIGRNGLLTLMADAQAGRFSVLVTESLDRLSRDQEDLAGIFKSLSFCGVELVGVNGGRADTVQIGVRGMLGALYLQDLADKTRRGLAGKIAEGKSAGGKAYGYRPVKGEPGDLEIVPEEAEVVRRIYQEYASGKSPRHIARDLNRDHVPAPRGAAWAANTLNGTRNKGTGMLRVPIYRGVIVWNKVRYVRDPETGRRVTRPNPQSEWKTSDAPHLRIVDDELWFKVQDRLGVHGDSGGRKHRVAKRRLLSGLLKCGVCGSGMTVNGGGDGRSRILCSRHRESASCAHKRSYYLDTVEAIVVGVLRKALAEPNLIHTFVETYVAERRKLSVDIAKQHNRAETELAKAKAALNRGIDALIAGRITNEEWANRRPELDARVSQAERELALCKSPAKVDLHPGALKKYRDAVDSLHDLLGKESVAAGHEHLIDAFQDLVHSVIVHPTPKGSPVCVEIFGQLSALTGEPICKMAVAGAGFEPAAFRL